MINQKCLKCGEKPIEYTNDIVDIDEEQKFNSAVSERIHLADPKVNEMMVHWLHWFLTDADITLEDVYKMFDRAYGSVKSKKIDYPWSALKLKD